MWFSYFKFCFNEINIISPSKDVVVAVQRRNGRWRHAHSGGPRGAYVRHRSVTSCPFRARPVAVGKFLRTFFSLMLFICLSFVFFCTFWFYSRDSSLFRCDLSSLGMALSFMAAGWVGAMKIEKEILYFVLTSWNLSLFGFWLLFLQKRTVYVCIWCGCRCIFHSIPFILTQNCLSLTNLPPPM